MRRAISFGLGFTLLLTVGCGDDSAPADASADAAPADAGDASPPSTSGVVGSACAADADCLAGLSCFTGPPGARPWPEGYCTRECASEFDCAAGSTCAFAYLDVDLTAHNLCSARCTREAGSRGGCREGYRCAGEGYCSIGCSSDDQCHTLDTYPGPPTYEPSASCELASGRCLHGTVASAQNGDACDSNADCRPPNGRCVLGACIASDCDLGGAYACGADEECVAWSLGFDSLVRVCAKTCRTGVDGLGGASPDERCAAGFSCAPREADPSGTATGPFCNLKADGVGESETATIGSLCSTVRDCPQALGYSHCVDGVCLAQYCAAPSLAGQDICGASALCLAPEADRATGGWESVELSLGLCLRDCSADPSVCEGSSTCVGGQCLTGAP